MSADSMWYPGVMCSTINIDYFILEFGLVNRLADLAFPGHVYVAMFYVHVLKISG